MTPKALVLQLLSVLEGPLDVALLVRAGAVFGFEPGAVRVALSRLSASGKVRAARRGSWRLTADAARVADQVATWRHLPSLVHPWDGGWVGVATGGLQGTDRTGARRRARALELFGFRTWRPGLAVRPDNRGPIEAIRQGLAELGVTAPVLTLAELGPWQAEVVALWDGAALDAACRDALDRLAHVSAGVPGMTPDEAARETFLAGGHAIRVLALDPLLPAPIVDVEARHALVAEMRSFDALGRRAWQRLVALAEVA